MTLKVRAWHKKEKKMYKVFGLSGLDSQPPLFVDLIETRPDGAEIIKENDKSSITLDDVILMFFTGLKDSKGKEIYEGDLLQVEDIRIVKVVWHQPSGSWDTNFVKQLRDETYSLPNQSWRRSTEIIGNLYEDKELLHENN